MKNLLLSISILLSAASASANDTGYTGISVDDLNITVQEKRDKVAVNAIEGRSYKAEFEGESLVSLMNALPSVNYVCDSDQSRAINKQLFIYGQDKGLISISCIGGTGGQFQDCSGDGEIMPVTMFENGPQCSVDIENIVTDSDETGILDGVSEGTVDKNIGKDSVLAVKKVIVSGTDPNGKNLELGKNGTYKAVVTGDSAAEIAKLIPAAGAGIRSNFRTSKELVIQGKNASVKLECGINHRRLTDSTCTIAIINKK